MTCMFDNKQYVAIASGSNIIAFAFHGGLGLYEETSLQHRPDRKRGGGGDRVERSLYSRMARTHPRWTDPFAEFQWQLAFGRVSRERLRRGLLVLAITTSTGRPIIRDT